jgi:parallel beta-helix repeat protein
VIDVKSGASFVAIQGLTIKGGPTDNLHAGVMVENCSHDVTISNNVITNNGAFGVRVYGNGCSGAVNVDIDGNTIQHNGSGVRLDYDSQGNQITNNQLINNDHLLVNDATAGNDNGANATQFYKSYGATLVAGNVVHGNRGPSHDYGFDGGSFEIFGASDLDIEHNTMWDNMNILETGTASGLDCSNNKFTNNVAYGGNDKSLVPSGSVATGMIIRCASNMVIANNTIDDIDWWVFDIQQNGNYSGSLAGLKIQNNVITQHGAKIYAFQVALPAGSIVDRDDVYVTGGAPIASVINKGNAYDLATLRAWTGTDQHSVSVDPQFTNAGGRDYHLRSSSPVIDLGSPISGVTDGFLGSAPDLGRFEAR